MSNLTVIPEVENGSCDGLGCGANPVHIDNLCFCTEYTAMRNEYQQQTNKSWDLKTADCKAWDAAWRFLWVKVNEND